MRLTFRASDESFENRLSLGDSRSFLCVNAALVLLKMLEAYFAVIGALPELAREAASRALGLLKVFNEQSVALVLGAGAVRLSHLKVRSITARHLSMALQAVDLVDELLPHVRKRLFAALSAADAERFVQPTLRALEADYAAHKQKLYSKLASVLHARVDAYARGEIEYAQLAHEHTALLRTLERSLDHTAFARAKQVLHDRVSEITLPKADDEYLTLLKDLV